MPPAVRSRSALPLLRRSAALTLGLTLVSAALPSVTAHAATQPTPRTALAARHFAIRSVTPHLIPFKLHNAKVPTRTASARATASDGTQASLVPEPLVGSPARSTWTVNYSGFDTGANGAAAQVAFQAAVNIWSRIVASPIPIVVNASWATLGTNVLGQANASTYYAAAPIGDGQSFYPSALADALYGHDVAPLTNPPGPSSDVNAQFNSSFNSGSSGGFYFGTDGAPPTGQVDFESVVLHELGHGLGFAGSMNVSSGSGSFNSPPMKFDRFNNEAAAGSTKVTTEVNPSTTLASVLQSQSVYWDGASGVASNGSRPRLYAPAAWEQGSSISHLDEATYPIGNANSLMTPAIGPQEAVHSPGAVSVGILHDEGWTAWVPGTVLAPDAPTAVTGTRGDGSAAVSWTPGNDYGGTVSQYAVTATPGGATCTSATVGCTVTGLTNGTAYTFKVTATNAAGTSPASAASAGVTPAGVPATPSAPTVTAGNSSATVNWNAPSSNGATITGYDVQWSSDSGQTWSTPLASAQSTTVTQATVTGLTIGTAYVFRVAARNVVGTGNPSLPSTAVTLANVPGAPTGVGGTRGDRQVVVTWTAPAANGGAAITGYDVESSSDNGAHWSTPVSSALTSSATQATVSGLTNGTPYVFQVAAKNAAGEGAFSTQSAFVTPATTPGVPSSISATPGNQQATVTWQPVASGGAPITSYDVRWSSDGGTSWTSVGLAYSGSPAIVTGLTNGTPYLFEVAAINSAGSSGYSAPSTATTPATTPDAPAAPAVARAGDGAVSVTWTVPVGDGGSAVTSYDIEWSIGGSTWSSPQSSTGSPAVVSGLANGTAYAFRVAALNTAGRGTFSDSSASITPATVPGAATQVAGAAGDGHVTVTWTAPVSNGGTAISGYDVEWSTDGSQWSGPQATTVTSATVNGLTNGVGYSFRVSAKNAVGTGSPSTPSASVAPAAVADAPTAVTGTRGNGLVDLSWTAPTATGGTAITGYDVEWSSDNGTSWSDPLGSALNDPALQATVTGLANGTSYLFRVAAVNGAGRGAFASPAAEVTPATTPGTPTGLGGMPGNAQVSLSWSAPASGGAAVSGYDVQWSTDDGTHWSGSLDSAAVSSATAAVVSGLTNGTGYTFRVAARNAVGAGDFTAPTSAVTPVTTPGAPTLDTPTRGDALLSVTWTAPSGDGGTAITGYDVEWSADNGTTWTGPLVSAWTSTGTTASLTGLTNGTAYVVKVAGRNAVGSGTFSPLSTPVTPATTPGSPATPSGARAGDGAVDLTWSAPQTDGGDAVVGYDVEWSSDGGSSWSQPLTAALSNTATAATVSGLTNGAPYVFRIAATNGVGRGAFSAASAAIAPAIAPGVPTSVAAAAGDSQATISWQPAASGGSAVTSYALKWSTNGGTTWTDVPTPYTTTPAVVTGLANGTSYVFEVAALNAVGLGGYSAPTAAVTPTRHSSSLSQAANVTIAYGATVTVSTVLKDSTTGTVMGAAPVKLMSRASTAKPWALVKSLTTTSGGVASLAVKPGALTMYEWQFDGTTGHAATTSAARSVYVMQTVAVSQTVTAIVHGGVVKFYGTVAPNAVNQYVYLQQKVGTVWKTTALKVRIVNQKMPNGKTMVGFVLALKTGSKGTYSYRINRPATAANAAGTSRAMTLKVT